MDKVDQYQIGGSAKYKRVIAELKKENEYLVATATVATLATVKLKSDAIREMIDACAYCIKNSKGEIEPIDIELHRIMEYLDNLEKDL